MVAKQCMNQNLSVGALIMQCYAYVDFIVSKFGGCNFLLLNKIECKREVVCETICVFINPNLTMGAYEYDVLVICLCISLLN